MGAAAPYVASPGWEATITHVPALTGVIISPETVHTPGVSEVRITCRPVASVVAPDANAAEPVPFVPGLLNVIIWEWMILVYEHLMIYVILLRKLTVCVQLN